MPQEKLEFNFPTANALCLKAGGDWRISAGLPSLGEITSQLESRPEINQLAFQFSQGIIWDSAFISLLLALHRYCQQKNIRFSLEALPAEIQKLLTLALKAPQKVIPNPAVQDGFLEGVGGKDGLLNVAQFERWAELVDAAMMRMIDENLMLMLPAAHVVKFPWGIDIPVRYQVAMDVVEMDADLEKDLEMVVRWQVMDAASRQAVFSKRSELVQAITPHDYFGLNEALSAATAALSSEIAEQLSIVAKRGEGRK
jgi:ABC-type transporter Mla MlaB component